MTFGILEFSQKTNEQIRFYYYDEFVRSFFGRIWGYQKSFRNYLTFRDLQNNVWAHLRKNYV